MTTFFNNLAEELLEDLGLEVTTARKKIVIDHLKNAAASAGMDSEIFEESMKDDTDSSTE